MRLRKAVQQHQRRPLAAPAQEDLGALDREGRGAKLTAAGERLLPDARRLLALNDETLARLKAVRVKGHVRLGASDDFAQTWLPSLIGRFARSHPGVRLDVAIETSEQLHSGLEEGRFDLIFARCWPGSGREVVWRQPLSWVAADWLDLPRGASVPLIASPAPCLIRRAMLEALEGCGRSWLLTGESVFTNGLQAAVLAGLGVTALGETTLLPGMRVLGEAEGFPPLAPSEIVLAVGRRPSRATEALTAFVRERLARLPAQAA